MTPFPLLVEVQWKRCTGFEADDMLNQIPVHAAAVPIKVFAFEAGQSTETEVGGHVQRVVRNGKVYPPTDLGVGPYDRIIDPRFGEFEVIGEPGNFDANGWWSPGLVVANVEKVDG